MNKSVIIKYLKEHYSLVSVAGNDDQNIQYLFTTPDKSMVITTQKDLINALMSVIHL